MQVSFRTMRTPNGSRKTFQAHNHSFELSFEVDQLKRRSDQNLAKLDFNTTTRVDYFSDAMTLCQTSTSQTIIILWFTISTKIINGPISYNDGGVAKQKGTRGSNYRYNFFLFGRMKIIRRSFGAVGRTLPQAELLAAPTPE